MQGWRSYRVGGIDRYYYSNLVDVRVLAQRLAIICTASQTSDHQGTLVRENSMLKRACKTN